MLHLMQSSNEEIHKAYEKVKTELFILTYCVIGALSNKRLLSNKRPPPPPHTMFFY